MRMRFVMAATALSAAVGCYRVKPVWEPEQFLNHAKPEVVYLRMRDVPPIAMDNPRLIGDTLHGTRPEGGAVAVAWSNVLDVYAKQIDGTRTAFAVTGMTIVSGLIVYSLVQNSGGDFGPSLCELPAGSYDHDLDPECSRP